MRRRTILFASALFAFAGGAASAGSLDVWEDSRGGPEVTASFPTGPAQQARIFYDASSAETGGLLFGASDIQILAKGSIEFVDFECNLQGCNQQDYVFDPGTEFTAPRPGRLSVTHFDGEPQSGIKDIGTITFHAPQEPGSMPLVDCWYTDLDEHEHRCSPFVVVTLPEPARAAALLAGVALLAGLRAHRRTRRAQFRTTSSPNKSDLAPACAGNR